MKFPFVLRKAEREVVAATREGVPAGPERPPKGARVEHDDRWNAFTVRAEVVEVLVRAGRPEVPGVVHLRNLRVLGDLELSWSELCSPLHFTGCRLTGSTVLVDATAQELRYDGCFVAGAIDATRVDVHGCVDIVSSAVRGVRLSGARVGGGVTFTGSTLEPDPASMMALDAAGLDTAGHLRLDEGFSAGARVTLRSATIGRGLICDGGSFRKTARQALDAQGIDVNGDVSCAIARDARGQPVRKNGNPQRFTADGQVTLLGAKIAGNLNFNGAVLRAEDDTALLADGLREVTGDFLMSVPVAGDGKPIRDRAGEPLRFSAEGEVRLLGSNLKGQLRCSGGQFFNKTADALSAHGAQMTDVFFDVAQDEHGNAVQGRNGLIRFESRGAVRLPGAIIAGKWRCRGGSFRCPQDPELEQIGPALDANGAEVTGEITLSRFKRKEGSAPFEAHGMVNLRNVKCRTLVCTGAQFRNPGDVAFDGSQMEVAREFKWQNLTVQG
ncbi:MAG: hypothetical protein LC733_02600, partial [Actinobacteria bacterium]|nr:hypothetical protein [Actinomycetota bacterium]